jgi:hypothetical protein
MKTLSVLQCDAHHSRHATACQTRSQSWLTAIRGRLCSGEWAAITPPLTDGPQTGDNPDAHKAARLQIRAQMDMGLCIPSDTRTDRTGNPSSGSDIAPGRLGASWYLVLSCAWERSSDKHVAFPLCRVRPMFCPPSLSKCLNWNWLTIKNLPFFAQLKIPFERWHEGR